MDMTEKRPALSHKRIVVYLLGLLVYAFGASLMARASIGISPLTSVAYIFTRFTPLSLGVSQFLFNLLLIGIQAVWMGKEFKRIEYLQILISIVFSAFIDLAMAATIMIDSAQMSFPARSTVFAVGLAAMSVGIAVVKITDLVMLPGDGVPKVMAYKKGWAFGKAKVISDSICAASTCVISLLALGHIEGIGVGTIVAALGLGNLARLLIHAAQAPLVRFVDGAKQ